MSSKTVYNRLMKLADHLERVPRKLFNMENWGKATRCGTQACIGGHACAVFPRRLRLVGSSNSDGYYYLEARRSNGWHAPWEGAMAFAKAIGISERDAFQLCMPGGIDGTEPTPRTPKQAAKLVRKLAEKYAA